MDIFTYTDIQNAYREASSHTKDVVFAGETAELVDTTTDHYGISTEDKRAVADELLYTLLRLTTKEEMVVRLTELIALEESAAQSLVSDLLGELYGNDTPPEPIPMVTEGETLPKAEPDTKERLELWPDGTPKSVVSEGGEEKGEEEEKTAAKPLTREELMSSLSPQRTMASDIETVRWQSEVEAEKKDRGGESE